MLAPPIMSSHGGQNSFPFGYDPTFVRGMGLPPYQLPDQPQGTPLLSTTDTAKLDTFFSGFDTNNQPLYGQQDIDLHFGGNPNEESQWYMPPSFVGSETVPGTRAGQGLSHGHGHGHGVNPHSLQMNALMWPHRQGQPPNFHMMQSSSPFTEQLPAYSAIPSFNPSFPQQLQSAAAGEIRPTYSPGFRQQPFQPHGAPLQTPGRGPPMRFGSDAGFGPQGFTMPQSQLEPSLAEPISEWLESNPNSRPTTQPNTQPSSPEMSRKRKRMDVPLGDVLRDQIDLETQGQNFVDSAKHRRRVSAQMKAPSNTIKSSNGTSHKRSASSYPEIPDDDIDSDDAPAESDDAYDPSSFPATTAEPSREPSPPPPWPGSKPRPPKSKNPPPPPKPSRKRKSESVDTPSKKASSSSKSRLNKQASSSSTATMTNNARPPSTRTPLTHAQKKANHTNSEQRRRDATARAYAELYDLVPEVHDMGKQSTMKKLEVVVYKVRETIRTVQMLRERLGIKGGGSLVDLMAAAESSTGVASNGFEDGEDERDDERADEFGEDDGGEEAEDYGVGVEANGSIG